MKCFISNIYKTLLVYVKFCVASINIIFQVNYFNFLVCISYITKLVVNCFQISYILAYLYYPKELIRKII